MRRTSKALVAFAVTVTTFIAGVSQAFADEGIATWYGPGYHGNVMANGQIYDMNDPTTTAANIFPFGTWVKVSNPANGKTVFVQVRDRGGFKHALDLSYAAFAALDDPVKMVVRVQYEVVPGPPVGENKPAAETQVQTTPRQDATPALPKPQPPSQGEVKASSGSSASTSYTVEPGDTLSAIASQFGISPQAVAKINGLTNADHILPGQVIKLREDGTPSAATSRGGSQVSPAAAIGEPGEGPHVVQAGETLSGIAQRFGSTVDQLLALNNISDPNLVRVGDQLRLAGAPSSPSPRPAVSSRPKAHVVQSGETLSGIALRYGLSEVALSDINDLVNLDQIRIGQELRLPPDQANGAAASRSRQREYTVETGDTLYGIALKVDATVEAILALNDLADENMLQLDQVLRLP